MATCIERTQGPGRYCAAVECPVGRSVGLRSSHSRQGQHPTSAVEVQTLRFYSATNPLKLLFTEAQCTFDLNELESESGLGNERIEVSEMRYVRILDLRLLNCYRYAAQRRADIHFPEEEDPPSPRRRMFAHPPLQRELSPFCRTEPLANSRKKCSVSVCLNK